MPIYLRLFYFFIFFSRIVILNATHVVGGEITYQYKGQNKYNLRLDLFIDCLNGNAGAISSDATAYIYVFSETSNVLISGFPVSVARSGPERLVKLNYNCIGNLPNACVDHYWYNVDVNLPAGKGNYIVSFQRCCRNGSITNLNQPLTQGANYWTTIPDATKLPDKKENSSAVFKELPPNFLCVNAPLSFDHSATDADGDSLVYDLFWPYLGANQTFPRPDNNGNGTPDYPPFQNINYIGSYTSAIPIDGNPVLNIRRTNGKINLIPTKTGQFVVGIRVTEYRKGVKISETKRDYQFNVLDCKLNVFAGFTAPSKSCDTVVAFKNTSIFASRYFWDFGVKNTAADTAAIEDPVFHYPGPGIYPVRLQVWGNNCKDTADDTLRLGRKFTAHITAQTEACGGKTNINISTQAPGFKFELNNNSYTAKQFSIQLSPGTYTSKFLVFDTFADCNDTSNPTFVILQTESDLRLANVFTPNDDGYNDCFTLKGNFSNCLKGNCRVFNRWGELVFYSPNLEFCWNGKVENTGTTLPEGVYFYQLETVSVLAGAQKKLITGSVNLLR
jgi:gliding motility-associated-like protein